MNDQLSMMGVEPPRAVFSPDRQYRYVLHRRWHQHGPELMVVGLNPSTADEYTDDNTSRLCVALAKREGYASLVLCNLFAWCSTDRKQLAKVPAPIGPQNDTWLRSLARDVNRRGGRVVVAWGTDGNLLHRADNVMLSRLLGDTVWCLGRTDKGFPRHPLYLSKTTPLERYVLRPSEMPS